MSSSANARETPADRELKTLANKIQRSKDLFEILGVPRSADDKTIKKAYRKVE